VARAHEELHSVELAEHDGDRVARQL
jgi:hypothetical protein